MTPIRFLKLIIVTLILIISYSSLQAQSGSVKGIITDENGIYMPGASVQINSINKATISDFDGKFTLVNVPEGNHTLKVQYLGFSDTEQQTNVEVSKTTFISIVLKSKSVELDDVTIIGYGNSGQARALNTQKNNINITNVVSTDQIGKFPDANIGDAVKRIPGITMQVDQGEARNIIVRGLSPQLNSVTLNGSRIPSAEGDNRNVQMDLIPSDMIQTIEVNKAVTPDMEGDALGGSVNLITRTAPQGFRLSATMGSGINFITDKRILNGSILIGDRSKNKKFGWMVSASINDNDFGSDNFEAEWTDEFEFNTGINDPDGDPILEEVPVNPYTNEFQIRTYLVERIRRSFAANFDYQFNSNHSVFLKTMYNWRDDRENRFRLEHKILDAEDIGADDFTVANGNVTRFPVEVKRQTKGGINNSRNKNRRLEDQRMQNYSLGGNHLFGNVKVDWMASYARASEERLNERYAEYESEYIINNDNSDPEFPVYTPVNATDVNNLSGFEYGEITEENKYTKEEDVNFFVNLEVPSDFFGKGDGSIKFGVRSRLKNKIRDNNFFEFDLESDFPTLSDVPVRDYTDPDFLAGSQYQAGIYADENWLGNLNLVNGESVPDEFLRANFDVDENVYAGYVMANQKLSEKFSILAGVRVEHTTISATGNRIEDEENVVGEITEEQSYTNFLPGIHFKYDLSSQTIFRFAWTNTLARPNYVDLVPSLDVISGDEEIVAGNPDLDPTTSMNFDLMAEHYFKSVGIVSGGLFYKQIDNFIYTFRGETFDDRFGTGTTGFDIFQPLNGDDASIFGVEIAFQRQLDFLPGFAKNFSIYLNYTYLTSSADGIRNEDGDVRSDLDLPNTAPSIFNGSLGYNDDKFSVRLSANFSEDYIDEIGGNSFEDRYYDQQFFLDFNASYAITKNLSVYADLNNITNQPLRFYQGISERTMQAEYYERRLTFGLKYDLFKK
ncbi:TonB-dependent receptor [Aquimarina sp. 2201CG5-10]|uniref:TonB-dependent receptor n=1 Tax=Aquimarina callyspongiae TaxID=3098150 RepID=UPI002AB37B52|nr:TonB-dependent receptor [Aquimarina sp. 2201CG5-10]MDY8135043.1 TonB-dependent receptor [Aquimarina sp. 2201CG5-10]